MDRQKLQRRHRHAHSSYIGVQCVQCSAKWLALHLAEFSPSIVGRSLEFVAMKRFGKELGNDERTINGPRGEFNFIFHSAKSQRKYVLVPLELNTSYLRLQR